MPSQRNKPPRGDVCIFGDSHLGSVKQAMDAGLIKTGGRKITFWGADGPNFRALRWKNGRIVPDAVAREIVAKINGGSHPTLAPGDFELFIFYGARLRAHEFFVAMLPYLRRPEGAMSGAAMQAVVDHWASKTRAWRLAKLFSMGDAQVIFVPTSFPTEGVMLPEVEKTRLRQKATKAERAILWGHMAATATSNGFTLMPQPEEFVTGDTLTKAEYAVDGAQASRDYVHKTPEFAARMIEAALELASHTPVPRQVTGA